MNGTGSNFPNTPDLVLQKISEPYTQASVMYADSPSQLNFQILQQNLQNCLAIVDHQVMKNYVPALQNCDVVEFQDELLQELNEDSRFIQFFRITELVYQEDEFSVHKLATVFHALSNKPCTLVLMIRSDGVTNNFYLGVRSRGNSSTGTMKQLLEQSLLGLFPGSDTLEYLREDLISDLNRTRIGCVSSVTCIADYKQDKDGLENKAFIQGLEKFIYSMRGKAFTSVFIANNLNHHDLVETRKEYEQIYTLMSPFSNMQYNYTLNQSTSTSDSDTSGTTATKSSGSTMGVSTNENRSDSHTRGTSLAHTTTDTTGNSTTVGTGQSHTVGTSDTTSESTSTTHTHGTSFSIGGSTGVNKGTSEGISESTSSTITKTKTTGGNIGNLNHSKSKAISTGIGYVVSKGMTFSKFLGANFNAGVSSSVSRSKTFGTAHTDSVSDTISKNLTYGINSSKSIGNTVGENQSETQSISSGTGTQYSENQSRSLSSNYAHTRALTDTFGNSQAVTLNVQNKSLINTLNRLEKQMERLDECESIGMWDFAAYFLGESAAEVETAAGVYRSLVSGNQSGLELAAVNTWMDEPRVMEIRKYVTNFVHPVFCYRFDDGSSLRETLVDATALVSTNELAIQMGLPRKSVKGLPVIEHAAFAQEVLGEHTDIDRDTHIILGEVSHLGQKTETEVPLDLQSLSMHTFITGSTGAGKSNTVYRLLSQLSRKNVKFLVVEPAKGEYKNVFGMDRDVTVYGTNPQQSQLLRINPFSFPKEIHIYEHLDRLVEIFNVCWPMYAAMPAILKDAIERAYVKAGWDLRKSRNKYSDHLFPTFIDILQQIDAVMEESQYSSDNKSDYKGALSTRLRSLTNGINGLVFSSDEIPADDLFDQNVIVDLSRVGSSETKSLIMGLLVMKLQEHRMSSCTEMNAKLNHVTVLEEAHNLLKRTSTEQSAEGSNLLGKSVEMLTNAIAEMRTYGEGFIIADQSPGLLDMSVIRNTNTKIIMRLPEYSDRELVGRAAGLNDEQIAELAKLQKGVAAIYQNDWQEAVLCKVCKHTPEHQSSFFFHPVHPENNRDIKGEIISRLLSKEIYCLTHGITQEDILKSNMPACAKCMLLDYTNTPNTNKLEAAAAATYELFAAQSAFSVLQTKKLDFQQQKRLLYQYLEPSLTSIPDEYAQIILYLTAYRHIQLTESPLVKLLLERLIEEEKRRNDTDV